MIPEEEARQLVVDTLYPFYSLLGVNKSKRSTTARDVCMDFMVFIQTAAKSWKPFSWLPPLAKLMGTFLIQTMIGGRYLYIGLCFHFSP
ncbi:hypothetical protein DL93DRAFT_2082975 [Clavulina sp. PMI_390]|nr:hypothetical protein DL93DRAFT_2082975 [Clavulina sp. PMI_390]